MGDITITKAPELSTAITSLVSNNTSYTDVTNLSVTIKTTGRPVLVMLVDDESGNYTNVQMQYNGAPTHQTCHHRILRDATVLCTYVHDYDTDAPNQGEGSFYLPSSCIRYLDDVAAGSYTYKVQAKSNDATNNFVYKYCKLMAIEL